MKEEIKKKIEMTLKKEWDKTQREIGFYTAINKVRDILDKENHIADIYREVNKLSPTSKELLTNK